MNRRIILDLLNQHRDRLKYEFGARHLALFGSAARDEMRDDSDIDVLVEFDEPPTYKGYFDLKVELERLLSRQIDLVTEKGLKPRARQHVQKDLIRVA